MFGETLQDYVSAPQPALFTLLKVSLRDKEMAYPALYISVHGDRANQNGDDCSLFKESHPGDPLQVFISREW